MVKAGVLSKKFWIRSSLAAAAVLAGTHIIDPDQVAETENPSGNHISIDNTPLKPDENRINRAEKMARLKPPALPQIDTTPFFVDLQNPAWTINTDEGVAKLLAMPAEASIYTPRFVFKTAEDREKTPVAKETVPQVEEKPAQPSVVAAEDISAPTPEQHIENDKAADIPIPQWRPDTTAPVEQAGTPAVTPEKPVDAKESVSALCQAPDDMNGYYASVIDGSDAKATRLEEVFYQGQREFFSFSTAAREITKNASAQIISDIQSALRAAGCLKESVSGVFDAHVTQALKDFQTDHKDRYNIAVTGRADPATLRALGREAMRVLYYEGRKDFLARFLRIQPDNYAVAASVEGGCANIGGLDAFRQEHRNIDINAIAADIGLQDNYVGQDLERGDKDTGEDRHYGPVRLAQFQLATLECTGTPTIRHGDIDGAFGPKTERWVKRFQTQYSVKYDLDVTGKLDELTRSALSYESSLVIAFMGHEIQKRSAQYGIDAAELTRMLMHESLGLQIAASGTGPAGLGQIAQRNIRGTASADYTNSMAADLGYERPDTMEEIIDFQTNIPQSIHASAAYFGGLLDRVEDKAPAFSDNLQFQLAYTSYRDGPAAGIRAIEALLSGSGNKSLNGAGVNGTNELKIADIEEYFDRKMNEPHKVKRGALVDAMRTAVVSAEKRQRVADASRQYQRLNRYAHRVGGLY